MNGYLNIKVYTKFSIIINQHREMTNLKPYMPEEMNGAEYVIAFMEILKVVV